MIFHNQPPSDQWKDYVNSFIYYKGFQPEHSIERVVPDGYIYLIMELDGIERHTYINIDGQMKIDSSFSGVWLSGLQKEYISISAHPNSEMFVIQFNPGGAFPFLPQTISNYKDQILQAQLIFGASINTFRNDIIKAEEVSAKIEVAENWLAKNHDRTKKTNSRVLNLINQITSTSMFGGSKISDLLDKDYYSKKHFIDLFKKQVGVTPKYFQRIKRFNEVINMIHQKKNIEWTSIAHQCGFFDQSHFIKEFKKFSGFNPNEFIGKSHHEEEQNFFPEG